MRTLPVGVVSKKGEWSKIESLVLVTEHEIDSLSSGSLATEVVTSFDFLIVTLYFSILERDNGKNSISTRSRAVLQGISLSFDQWDQGCWNFGLPFFIRTLSTIILFMSFFQSLRRPYHDKDDAKMP